MIIRNSNKKATDILSKNVMNMIDRFESIVVNLPAGLMISACLVLLLLEYKTRC